MKKVTGISFLRTSEGLRVAFTYSEIDSNGNVTEKNKSGSYINMDQATETFVAGLEASITERLG